jgi:hypothetical protein
MMPQTIEWLAENYDLDPRVVAGLKELIAAEREACAKAAETIGWSSPTSETEFAMREAAKVIAAKIRNRTN